MTFGEYKINMSPTDIQDELQRANKEVFQMDIPSAGELIPGLMIIRIHSRFTKAPIMDKI